MISIENIRTIESPREVIHDIYTYIEELPISGGWGHTKEEAVIIDMNDPIVDSKVPFNGIDIEYIFAKHRTYIELITIRDENDRFSGIEFETIKQELHHGEEGKKYDRLVQKISVLRSKDYNELKKTWESNLDNVNFDKEAHWKRDEKLRIHMEREFWFEISSFYGKNFVILDESNENGGSVTVKMI